MPRTARFGYRSLLPCPTLALHGDGGHMAHVAYVAGIGMGVEGETQPWCMAAWLHGGQGNRLLALPLSQFYSTQKNYIKPNKLFPPRDV